MKRLILILIALVTFASAYSQEGVLIGKKEGTPNKSAKLEVYSTTSGILIPRMTTAERNSINPDDEAISLLVFDISDSTFYFFNGIDWEKLGSGRDIDVISESLDTITARLGELEESLAEAMTVDSVQNLPAEGRNSGDVVIVEDNGEGFRETFVWSDTNDDGEPDAWVGVTIRPRASGYSLYWFQDDGTNDLNGSEFTDDKIITAGTHGFNSSGYTISTPYDGYYVLAFPSEWGRPEFYINGGVVFDGMTKQLVTIDGILYQAWSFYVRIPSTYTGPDLTLTAVK